MLEHGCLNTDASDDHADASDRSVLALWFALHESNETKDHGPLNGVVTPRGAIHMISSKSEASAFNAFVSMAS
jgi:hypothetical protein